MNILLLGAAVVSLLAGLASVPLLVYGLDFTLRDSLPRVYREPMARILFTLGQIANGATALVLDGYEWTLVRMEETGGEYRLPNGDTPETVVRFGLRPFAIVADRDNIPDRFERDAEAPLESFTDPITANRMVEYRPWSGEDGPLVNMVAVAERISPINRAGLDRAGFEQALEDSGGAQNIGPIVYTVLVIVLVVVGSTTGLIAMGVVP